MAEPDDAVGTVSKVPSPFYCPFPGCKRKFASLWRLKVHYRAPPNERGSGKERGHGVELPICPACNERLEPGKHHNKCKAGRTTNPPSKRVPKSAPTTARSSKQQKTAHTATKKSKERQEPEAPPPNAVDTTSGSSFPEAAVFSPRRAAPAHVANTDERAFMPTAGFPAFEFNYLSVAARGSGVLSDVHNREGSPQHQPSHLSAEGAAEVLFGIAKSESESNPDLGLKRGSTGYMMPIGGESLPVVMADMHAAGAAPAQLPSPPPLNRDSDGAAGVSVPHQTVEGVPIDTMAGMPVMVPWGAQGAGPGNEAVVSMVMTQNGLMQMVQAGGQQYLMPLQTIRASNGEELAVAIPPVGALTHGIPMLMHGNDNGSAHEGAHVLVHGGQQHPGGFAMIPASSMLPSGVSMVPMGYPQDQYGCTVAVTSEGPNVGISEEDFHNAVQMAQAAEVPAR